MKLPAIALAVLAIITIKTDAFTPETSILGNVNVPQLKKTMLYVNRYREGQEPMYPGRDGREYYRGSVGMSDYDNPEGPMYSGGGYPEMYDDYMPYGMEGRYPAQPRYPSPMPPGPGRGPGGGPGGYPNQRYRNQGNPNQGMRNERYPNQGYPNQRYPNQRMPMNNNRNEGRRVVGSWNNPLSDAQREKVNKSYGGTYDANGMENIYNGKGVEGYGRANNNNNYNNGRNSYGRPPMSNTPPYVRFKYVDDNGPGQRQGQNNGMPYNNQGYRPDRVPYDVAAGRRSNNMGGGGRPNHGPSYPARPYSPVGGRENLSWSADPSQVGDSASGSAYNNDNMNYSPPKSSAPRGNGYYPTDGSDDTLVNGASTSTFSTTKYQRTGGSSQQMSWTADGRKIFPSEYSAPHNYGRFPKRSSNTQLLCISGSIDEIPPETSDTAYYCEKDKVRYL